MQTEKTTTLKASIILVGSSCQWVSRTVWSENGNRFLSYWRTSSTELNIIWLLRSQVYEHNSWGMRACLTLPRVLFRWRWKPLGCQFVKDPCLYFWGVKTIRHLYCPFPGWALTHPVYWKEFNRRQLGPYGAWSHPKSLVMIALFCTGCPLFHSLGSWTFVFPFPLCSVITCY